MGNAGGSVPSHGSSWLGHGSGCWMVGESWGAVMWVILEEGLCAGEEGGDVVARPLDAAWGPSCPKHG